MKDLFKALFIILAAGAFMYITYSKYIPLPEQRVVIVHDYTEGYAEGYRVGKLQALDDDVQ